MATAFMGYVLPFGQMSFWGATVITNLLSPFPSLIEWVSGGHYVYNPTLKRFFIFHFQFPFLLCGFRILHLFYLHFLSSNNPLRNSTNNKPTNALEISSLFFIFFVVFSFGVVVFLLFSRNLLLFYLRVHRSCACPTAERVSKTCGLLGQDYDRYGCDMLEPSGR